MTEAGLRPGQQLGRFVLLERLAMGGMAELWTARGTDDERRTYALKFPKDYLLSNAALRTMFLDECQIARQLRHPNIVKVLGGFEHEGRFFQAMELVQGYDLKKVLVALAKRSERFDAPMALRIVRDVARGLSYAHQKRTDDGTWLQLVHRDVSPQNVMIEASGGVKVVDFGVAKAAARLTKTRTGVVKGKIPYMAPEQALAKEVSPATDIFALGVILWELLAMRRLFVARSELELFRLVCEAAVPEIDLHAPGLLPSVSGLVMQMLARRPEDRPSSMREVEERLSRILFVECADQDVSAEALAAWLAPRMNPRRKTKVMPSAQPLAPPVRAAPPVPPAAALVPESDAEATPEVPMGSFPEESSGGGRGALLREISAPWIDPGAPGEDGPTVRATPDTTQRVEPQDPTTGDRRDGGNGLCVPRFPAMKSP